VIVIIVLLDFIFSINWSFFIFHSSLLVAPVHLTLSIQRRVYSKPTQQASNAMPGQAGANQKMKGVSFGPSTLCY